MARYSGGDGMTKVVFVTAEIADIAAPTATVLNAGTDWSSFITKDGLSEPSDQNNIPVASLSDTYNAEVPGSFGGAIELTVQRDNESDTVWDAITYGLEGHLVVRSGKPSAAAFAADDDVRVYPVIWHEPVPVSPSSDTADQFTAMGPVHRQPNLKAVVA